MASQPLRASEWVAFEYLGIPFDTDSRLAQWPFGRNYQSYYRPPAAGSNMAGSYPLGRDVTGEFDRDQRPSTKIPDDGSRRKEGSADLST
ncbi:hypothetical protein MRX96_004736 [Rhipicephalus microplus]